MNIDIVRMHNLHDWVWITFSENSMLDEASGSSNKTIAPSTAWQNFYAKANERFKQMPGKTISHALNIARIGFYGDDRDAEGLTVEMANRLIRLFNPEGLTLETLEQPRADRSLYVVLAKVSFHNTYAGGIGDFLDMVFKDNPFIESACSTFGSHDCHFTIWATTVEIELWLWKSLRNYDCVSDVSSLTYPTYSGLRQRFSVARHPDYIHVLKSRNAYESLMTTSSIEDDVLITNTKSC